MALTAPNHTKLSNEFIDEYMNKMSGSASKVFIAISRKTAGWQKISDYISISQIALLTGLSNRSIIKAIKELEFFDLIQVNRKERSTSQFTIKYEISDEKSLDLNYTSDEKSPASDEKSPDLPQTSDKRSHTKESIKETKQKKECPLFEEWYNRYDKKKAKKDALSKWNKLSLENKKKCLLVVNNYVRSTPDRFYRKNPDTYLNKEAWEDEIIFSTQQNKQTESRYSDLD